MLAPGCEARCPGCAHRELSATESENRKLEWLRAALSSWSAQIEPVRAVSGERRFGYRDKTVLHAWRAGEHWAFGMMISRRGLKDDEYVAIPNCPVHTSRVRESLGIFSDFPSDHALKFISVTGALVTLVLKQKSVDEEVLEHWFKSKELRLRGARIEGVFINLNPSAGNRVLAPKAWKKIWGAETVRGPMGLEHGPQSFQQLIPELYEDATAEAAKELEIRPEDYVLDLYSGLGATVRKWKASGASVLGVELLGEAVRLFGDEMIQGRVSDRLPQIQESLNEWRSRGSQGKWMVFANPPRLGLEPEVVDWIGREGLPDRVVYLSCSAGTLARDLAKLENYAYRVKRIIPYDFFPQTQHIETLVCLDRASGVSRVVPVERLRRTE